MNRAVPVMIPVFGLDDANFLPVVKYCLFRTRAKLVIPFGKTVEEYLISRSKIFFHKREHSYIYLLKTKLFLHKKYRNTEKHSLFKIKFYFHKRTPTQKYISYLKLSSRFKAVFVLSKLLIVASYDPCSEKKLTITVI